MMIVIRKYCLLCVTYDLSSTTITKFSVLTLPGLPEAVCHRASEMAVTAPEFAQQLAQVIKKLPSGKLSVLPSPFRRDWLVWAGASLFASVKVKLMHLTVYISDHKVYYMVEM